jgi:diguanylate cyclase (GGDEF)-like protein
VGKGFDLVTYWRRSVYSAAAARVLAKATRACDPEEAFIASLLQDVGMLAAHAALGEQYDQVLARAPEDHDELPDLETSQLGFDHALVGGRLAEKWRLPVQLIESTRLHHRPEHAPPSCLKLVRYVVLAGDAAATLTLASPRERLARFLERAAEWFGLEKEQALAALQETSDGAAQLSSLLELKTGRAPDAATILAEANERLILNQIRAESEAMALQARNRTLAQQAATDGLTGIGNRATFDEELARCFDQSRASGQPLAVLFADADEFKAVNDSLGHQAGDVVLQELSRRFGGAVESRGAVFRYGGEEFVAILPGFSASASLALAEKVRRAVEARPIDLRSLGGSTPEVRCTISIGAACCEPASPYASAADLVRAADQAVYAAKQAGRNRVRMAGAQRSTEVAQGRRVSILVIEEDALAAKLLELMLGQRPDVAVRSAPSASAVLRAGPGPNGPPDLVIIDPRLAGKMGLELVRAMRTQAAWRGARIIVLSSSRAPEIERAAREAGADAFISKAQFCSNFARWVPQIVDEWGRTKRAA